MRNLRIHNLCKLTYAFSNITIMKPHEFDMKKTFIQYIFNILHKSTHKYVEFSVKCMKLAFCIINNDNNLHEVHGLNIF